MYLPDRLNEASQLKNLQDEYFVRMMLPQTVARAAGYIAEEKTELSRLLASIPEVSNFNLAVVGAGALTYVDLCYGRVRQYVAIEPLTKLFIPESVRFFVNRQENIHILEEPFGDSSLPIAGSSNTIYVFHFNILSYIPRPIKKINQYIRPGDILFISSWNSSLAAQKERKEYFSYLNKNMAESEFVVDPDATTGLCNLDIFPFEKLNSYQKSTRIKGNITDILIVYC